MCTWCILSLNVVRENTPVHIPIVINPLMTIVYGHTRERTSFSIVRRSKTTSQNLEPDSHTYAHETFQHKTPAFQPVRASCMCASCACAYERHEQTQKMTFLGPLLIPAHDAHTRHTHMLHIRETNTIYYAEIKRKSVSCAHAYTYVHYRTRHY